MTWQRPASAVFGRGTGRGHGARWGGRARWAACAWLLAGLVSLRAYEYDITFNTTSLTSQGSRLTTSDTTPTLGGAVRWSAAQMSEFRVTVGGGQVGSLTGGQVQINSTVSPPLWSLSGDSLSALPEGSHTVYVECQVGDTWYRPFWSSYYLAIDLTAPSVTGATGYGNTVVVQIYENAGLYDYSIPNLSAQNASFYSLVYAGPDGEFGGADDVPTGIPSASLSGGWGAGTASVYLHVEEALQVGRYGVRVQAQDGVHDNAGHWLVGNAENGQAAWVEFVTPPYVVDITSSAADGVYTAGAQIPIQVQFSQAVVVDTTGGTPSLGLDLARGSGTAAYTGGSGTGTLTFLYTVLAGQASPDLDGSSSYLIALHGGTMVSTDGVAAVVDVGPGAGHTLADHKDIAIEDGEAPWVTDVASTSRHVFVSFADDGGIDPVSAGNLANYQLLRLTDGGVVRDEDMAAHVVESFLIVDAHAPEDSTFCLFFDDVLPAGEYQLTVNAQAPDGVHDRGGNYLDGAYEYETGVRAAGDDYVVTFTIRGEATGLPPFAGQMLAGGSGESSEAGAMGFGDLNRDGCTDMVDVATSYDGVCPVLAVWPGLGNGTVGPVGREYPLPGGVWYGMGGIVVREVTGDANPDVVVVWVRNGSSGTRSVGSELVMSTFPGNGDGTLGERIDTVEPMSDSASPMDRDGTAARSRSSMLGGDMGMADFNGDGILDIVGGASFAGAIMGVALGNGDGTFGAPVYVDGPTDGAYSGLRIADLDGDGRPDMVAADSQSSSGTGTVRVYMNRVARAGFALELTDEYATGPAQAAMLVLDVNGDDALDLVTVHHTGSHTRGTRSEFPAAGTLEVRLGNGTGGFATTAVVVPGAPGYPNRVFVGGTPGGTEFVGVLSTVTDDATETQAGVVSAFVDWQGDDFAERVDSILGAGVYSLYGQPAFLDGDAVVDLVLRLPGRVLLALGRTGGTFGPPVLDTGANPTGAAVADVDGDGTADLAVVCPLNTALYLFRGLGGGTFAQPQVVDLPSPCELVAAGEFNGVAGAELVVGSQLDYVVYVLVRDPDTDEWTALADGPLVEEAPVGMVIADADSDGDDDLLVAGEYGGLYLFAADAPVEGAPQFAEPVWGQTDSSPVGLAMADLDGDGLADAVTANGEDGSFSVAFAYLPVREVHSGFDETVTYYVDALYEATSVCVADVDGDEAPDVLVGGYSSQSDNPVLVVYRNAGDGVLALSQELGYAVPFWPEPLLDWLAAADVDDDGDVDVVGGGGGLSDVLLVWHGQGDGTLTGPSLFTAGASAATFCLGDATGDGRPDVLAVNSTWDRVSLIQNVVTNAVATPTFNPPAGALAAATNVVISCATAGATIRYTTDGSEPTETHGTVIASGGTVAVTAAVTLKARAWKDGMDPSQVATAAYTFAPQKPVLDPAGGQFHAAVDVTVTCATAGATLRYTTDGSDPTEASTAVSGGVVRVSGSLTLKVRAFKAGWTPSIVASAEFVLRPVAPVLDPPGGALPGSVNVSVTCATVDSVVRYTTDGSDPTEASTAVGPTGIVVVDQPLVLTARAFRAGWGASEATQVVFSMTVATPTIVPDGGSYDAEVPVTIATATPQATVRYTTDGSVPTENSLTVPAGGQVTVDRSITTLRARAWRALWTPSDVAASQPFVLHTQPPTFVPDGGVFAGPVVVQVTSPTAHARFYYTTDGTTPTLQSPTLGAEGTLRLAASCTLAVLACRDGWEPSAVHTADFVFDITGPRVVGQDPKLGILGPADRITLTFSEPIDPATFTPTPDVVAFVGPDGVIAAHSITWLSPTRCDVLFLSQGNRGNYRLVIGPDIRDLAGNQMDQDENQVCGQVPADRYTAEFAIVQGPYVTGHTPFGDQVKPVSSIDVTFSQAMSVLTFTKEDVTITAEPSGVTVPTLASEPSYVSTTGAFRLTFASAVSQPATYHLWLGPNIASARGDLLDQDRDAVLGEAQHDRYDAGFTILDVAGPRVLSYTPERSSGGGLDHVDVTFSEAINPASFTPADAVLSIPGGQTVAIDTVTQPTAGRADLLRVAFAAQAAAGTYRLRLGPDIRDLTGNLMDQDRDGFRGEPGDDRYSATVVVDNTGPRVLGFAYTAPLTGTTGYLDLRFSEAVAAASLAPTDATVTGPTGAPCAVASVAVGSAPAIVRIGFTAPAAHGHFAFTFGPDVLDLTGNAMDQNSDGTPGDGFSGEFDQFLPDLTVTSVSHPEEARSAEFIDVSWTVANVGRAELTGSWVDRIQIRAAAGRERAAPVGLDNVAFTGTLAIGGSYTRVATVQVPDGYDGSFWIEVVTDPDAGSVFEPVPGAANTGSPVAPLLVTRRPAADLQVTGVRGPASLAIGEPCEISWEVTNVTAAPERPGTSARYWLDRVYLSTNNVLDPADVQFGSDARNPGSLAAAEAYTQTVTLNLPTTLPAGSYYLIVQTDVTDLEEEFDLESNNTLATTVAIPAVVPSPALLEVTDVQLSKSTANWGEVLTVNWTVTNTGGSTATRSGGWFNDGFGFDNAMIFSADEYPLFAPGSSDQVLFWHKATYRGTYAPGTAVSFSETFTVPSDVTGTYYVFPWPDPPQWTNLDKIQRAATLTVTPPAFPDLVPVAGSLTVPDALLAGQSATLSLRVANQGTVAATGSWSNTVYLSTDAVADASDVLAGPYLYANDGGLAAGAQTPEISIPAVLPRVTAGTYYVIVVVNGAAGSGPRETTRDNNGIVSAARPLTVPTADLVPTAFTCPVTSGDSGSVVRFQWTVQYTGSLPSSPTTWTDAVHFSTDGQLSAQTRVGQQVHTGALASGASYNVTADVTLPARTGGTFRVFLVADGDDTVYEPGAETNNTRELAASFTVVNRAADLSVIVPNPPTTGLAGSVLNLFWQVSNLGDGAATASWTDACYLSADDTLDTKKDSLVSSSTRIVDLAVGATYQQGSTANGMALTIPDDIEGAYYLFVVTDRDAKVYEAGRTANNVMRLPLRVFDRAPDLQISDVTAPTEGVAGEVVLVNWRGYNRGDAPATGTWHDAVYLSTDTTFDAQTDTLFSQPSPNKVPLGAGEYYEPVLTLRDVQARLPARIDGTFWIFIVADAGNKVYERAAGEANNVYMVPTPIQVRNLAPDLRVTEVLPAMSAVTAGNVLTVTWSVANAGLRPTTEGYWQDGVYLSADADLDPPSDIELGTVPHTGNLAADGTYTVTQTFALRQDLSGPYTLYVATDLRRHVYEYLAETNNKTAAAQPVLVNGLMADLVVTDVDFGQRELSAVAGSTLSAGWTVANQGVTPTGAGEWSDTVYLSADDALDDSDLVLARVRRTGGLAPDEFYTVADSPVTLPDDALGTYCLMVKTDGNTFNEIYEADAEDNNVSEPVEITIGAKPLPNIVPHDVQVNDGALTIMAGQPLTVAWSESNLGNATAISRSPDNRWFAYVYLSRDTYLDPDRDICLGNLRVDGPLAVEGGRETLTSPQVRTFDGSVPRTAYGWYYVLVHTDVRNEVAEGAEGELDNVAWTDAFLDVAYAEPADLAIESVAAPVPEGDPAGPIYYGDWASWSYRVRNLSATESALGVWRDRIWLSVHDDINRDNVRVTSGSLVHNGPLGPGAAYDGTYEGPVPAVVPGTYYVVVGTDVADEVNEVWEVNNNYSDVAFTSRRIEVAGYPVPLSDEDDAQGWVEGEFSHDLPMYWQVDNVPAGQTLVVEAVTTALFGDDPTVSLRWGNLPTLFGFDVEGERRAVVRDTKAGTYYIRLAGEGPCKIHAYLQQYGIDEITPNQASNTGEVTVEIVGSGFTTDTAVKLVNNARAVIQTSTAVDFWGSSLIYATFDLRGVAAGPYAIMAEEPNGKWDSEPFTVTEEGEGEFFGELIVPPETRQSRPSSLTVRYGNRGSVNVPAPLLIVRCDAGVQWRYWGDDPYHSDPIQLMGVSYRGDPSVLKPGETRSFTINYKIDQTGQYGFYLYMVSQSSWDSVNWSAIEAAVRPTSGQSPMGRNWSAVWREFLARCVNSYWGADAGGFVEVLNHGARLRWLARRSTTPDVSSLIGAELADILALLDAPLRGTLYYQTAGSGEGLPGVELRATNWDNASAYRTVTRADGSFGFVDIPAGTYHLSSPDYAISPSKVTVEFSWNLPRVEGRILTAFPSGGLYGRVLTSPSRSLAGESVLITNHSAGEFHTATLSGDGRYSMTGLKPGTYSVRYGPQSLTRGGMPYGLSGDAATGLEVEAGRNLQVPDLRSLECTTISGTVYAGGGLDEEDVPLSGACVTLVQGLTDVTNWFTSTSGFFELPAIPPGTYWLSVSAPGYLTNTTDEFQVGFGADQQVRAFYMRPGADPFGTPSSGSAWGYISGLPTTRSNCWVFGPFLGDFPWADSRDVEVLGDPVPRPVYLRGEYRLGGLYPGRYAVVVTGGGAASPGVFTVDVPEGGFTRQDFTGVFGPFETVTVGPDGFYWPPNDVPPQSGREIDRKYTVVQGSHDPNDKLIDAGVGPLHAIEADTPIPYTIRFENDKAATASVQLLTIVDPLSPLLDWSTFELGNIQFRNIDVPVPPGLTSYTTDVDMEPYGIDLVVQIVAEFDATRGVAEWTFSALDPATGEFTEDPMAGFLPPNNDAREGEGFVEFTVSPRADLVQGGSRIENVATIVFDWNEPMDTPVVFNTIDAEAPTATMTALPALSGEAIALAWGATDDVGVAFYDVYVSVDGAETLWLEATRLTSAVFVGVPGKVYTFRIVATDYVGNTDSSDTTSTTTVAAPTIALVEPTGTTVHPGDVLTIAWAAANPGGLAPTIALYWDADTSPLNNNASRAEIGWGTIATGLAFGSTSYNWTVPANLGADRVYLAARIADGAVGNTDYTARSIAIGDADRDGLPDTWEEWAIANLGDTLTLEGFTPAGDDDGDGWTSLAEYLAGSDPANPLSLPDWRMALEVRGSEAEELVFGYAASATDAWDADVDREGAADLAWLDGPEGHPYLDRSLRAPASTQAWPLQILAGGERSDAELVWDPAAVPPDFALFLTPAAPGRAVADSLDMVANASATVTADGQYTLELVPPETVDFDLQGGWNLLSLPCQPSDSRTASLFGTRASQVYVWRAAGAQSRYETPATLDAKQGAWVYWGRGDAVSVRGRPLRDTRVSLAAGWNLVGAIAGCILPDVPAIVGPAWTWDAATGTYQAVAVGGALQPGKGYWVYATAAGLVDLAAP